MKVATNEDGGNWVYYFTVIYLSTLHEESLARHEELRGYVKRASDLCGVKELKQGDSNERLINKARNRGMSPYHVGEAASSSALPFGASGS